MITKQQGVQTSPTVQTPRVFISYSHQDETWKDRLAEQLKTLEDEGLLNYWHDRQIEAGSQWRPELLQALESAHVCVLLISRHFLNSDFIRGEEVPRILSNSQRKGTRIVPVIVSPCLWQEVEWLEAFQGATRDNIELSSFTTEHERDTELVRLAQTIKSLAHSSVGSVESHLNNQSLNTPTPPAVVVDQLPTVAGEFFGRSDELTMLDQALVNPHTQIIQFIAAGGTGKTKLLRHWLDQKQLSGEVQNRIIWSFYSQGTTDSKQVSASPLFEAGFKAFGIDSSQFRTDEDRADAFVDGVIQHQCLLVLDGLEPMQHGGKGMDGRLKDRAMSRLLKRLINLNCPLCVITTRIQVYEVSDRAQVVSHNLNNLTTSDGVALLSSLGVHGGNAYQSEQEQLAEAVEEYGNHALALHLLGNALYTYLDGDVLKRYKLNELIDDFDPHSRHAFKVMKAYETWLVDEEGRPLLELQLLYLLSLFDHPVDLDVVELLVAARIKGVCSEKTTIWQRIRRAKTLNTNEIKELKLAIRRLQGKHRLLSTDGGNNTVLDCHPLIREYFGNQLKKQKLGAWKKAHKILYEYYKSIPKQDQPDMIEEMRPLFAAVFHGCESGQYQKVLDDVYYPRIARNNDSYLSNVLGAHQEDLALLSKFFSEPWGKVDSEISLDDQAAVFQWSGYNLRAMGRLEESVEPMRRSLYLAIEDKVMSEVASSASTLSEIFLALGDITNAMEHSIVAVDSASQTDDALMQIDTKVEMANILFQAGSFYKAEVLFRTEEESLKECRPELPILYSISGYQYCDLLLFAVNGDGCLEKIQKVIKRSLFMIDVGKGREAGLDISLGKLSLAKSYMQYPSFLDLAQEHIRESIEGLRGFDDQEMLNHGLLTRAAFFRLTGDFTKTQQDLDEVYEIAEPSGMRLHLTDYHLESARLGFAADWPIEKIKTHIQQADDLIQATGYHRRDRELKELKEQLDTHLGNGIVVDV